MRVGFERWKSRKTFRNQDNNNNNGSMNIGPKYAEISHAPQSLSEMITVHKITVWIGTGRWVTVPTATRMGILPLPKIPQVQQIKKILQFAKHNGASKYGALEKASLFRWSCIDYGRRVRSTTYHSTITMVTAHRPLTSETAPQNQEPELNLT